MSGESADQKCEPPQRTAKSVDPGRGWEKADEEVRNSNLDARQTSNGLQLSFVESRIGCDENAAAKSASYVHRGAKLMPGTRLTRVEFILPSGWSNDSGRFYL